MPRNPYHQGRITDHFDGTRFFNPSHPSTDHGPLDLLRWRLAGGRIPWPATTPASQTIPDARVNTLRVTMIGHATFLIQVACRNILIDPVWSDRASPLPRFGPKRVNPPGVAFDDLPPIDLILLTHNHYDHLDTATLKRLWNRDHPQIVAPLGNDAVVAKSHPDIQIQTHDWGETTDLGNSATLTLTPGHHWSARGIRDRRMALWCGFILTTQAGTIYIAGDTGYGDGQIFRDLKRHHSPIDLAILPIGAYAPRWFMQTMHVNPAEAVQIMLDCGAQQALGTHWATFRLTDEPRLEPRQLLAHELARQGLAPASFIALEPADVWTRP